MTDVDVTMTMSISNIFRDAIFRETNEGFRDTQLTRRIPCHYLPL